MQAGTGTEAGQPSGKYGHHLMDLRRQCLADGEQSNSSRTSVRLGA